MKGKPSVRRNAASIAMLICILLFTSCAVPSGSHQADSRENRNGGTKDRAGTDDQGSAEAYQKVTLLDSSYSLPEDEAGKIREILRKNLVSRQLMSEERAEGLIENGTFERRYIEIADERVEARCNCQYYASVVITVWKSADYFAVCGTENADFTPDLVSGEDLSFETAGDAWADVEEGVCEIRQKSELIPVVIGRTVVVRAEAGTESTGEEKSAGGEEAYSCQYLERISVAYDPISTYGYDPRWLTPSYEKISDGGTVALTAQKEKYPYKSRTVDLVLTNDSDASIMYGRAFQLEVEIDGTWYKVPPVYDPLYFTLEGIILSPHSTAVLEIPISLYRCHPGKHRIIKNAHEIAEGRYAQDDPSGQEQRRKEMEQREEFVAAAEFNLI